MAVAGTERQKAGSEQRKIIIRTALILAGLTAIEFLIAFTWRGASDAIGISRDTGLLMKNAVFIILTLFKAFYIVGVFMHLKDEVKRLAWTILIPFIFIVWLIIALIKEGDTWGKQSPENTGIEIEQIEQPRWTDDNVKLYG